MQHGKHNLRKATEFRIHLSVIAIAFHLLSPSNAHATVKMGTLKGMKSFKLMVLTIANLNFAMKQAAENPMDGWRRQNVAHAMGMLPPAILALAKDFKQGKLHDGDLPVVQGIMGGFMKKDFAGQYQNFMKNPSKDKIPKVGSGFPQDALKNAEKATVQMDESKREVASAAALSDSGDTDSSPKISQTQLASLDSSSLAYGAQPKLGKSSGLGKKDDKAVRMIEEKRFDANADKAGSDSKASFAEEMNQEIMKVERGLSGATIRKNQAVLDAEKERETEEAAEKSDFFKVKKKKAESIETDRRRKTLKKRPLSDKTSSLDLNHIHYRKPLMVYMVDSLFKIIEGRAFAGNDAPADAPPSGGQGPQQNRPGGGGGGGCKDCGGGGAGGGGGGGAAEILQGMAFMMAAVAPVAAAAMQADADKKIAKINAQTQIQLTQMTAETSRYMADKQKQLAEFQAKVTEEIAQRNNEAQTERLNIQLAELKASREQARESEKEKRGLEDKYNEQRVALAQKQADDNLRFQQQTLTAQVTQAGLATGFKNARPSSGALSVDRVQGSSFASSGVPSSNPFASSNFNAVTGGGATASAGNPAGLGGGAASGNTAGNTGGLAFMAPRNKLIAAVGNVPASQDAIRDPMTGAWIKKPIQYGAVTTRGLASNTGKVATRGFVNGTARLAQGSTRGMMQRVPNEFDKFVALASTPSKSVSDDYASDRNSRIRGTEVAATPGSAHGNNAARGITGGRAYNARGIREVSTSYSGSN